MNNRKITEYTKDWIVKRLQEWIRLTDKKLQYRPVREKTIFINTTKILYQTGSHENVRKKKSYSHPLDDKLI